MRILEKSFPLMLITETTACFYWIAQSHSTVSQECTRILHYSAACLLFCSPLGPFSFFPCIITLGWFVILFVTCGIFILGICCSLVYLFRFVWKARGERQTQRDLFLLVYSPDAWARPKSGTGTQSGFLIWVAEPQVCDPSLTGNSYREQIWDSSPGTLHWDTGNLTAVTHHHPVVTWTSYCFCSMKGS